MPDNPNVPPTAHYILLAVQRQVAGLAAERNALREQVAGLVAERDALRNHNAQLEQDKRRLTWILRSIDIRLHDEVVPMAHVPAQEFLEANGLADLVLSIKLAGEQVESAPTHYAIAARTFRQICNCAVSATSKRPAVPEGPRV